MFQAMNQDIYDAVMDAKAAQERVVDGGSTQSDDADDEPVKPTRIREEALRAMLIVEEYISGITSNVSLRLVLAIFHTMLRFCNVL